MGHWLHESVVGQGVGQNAWALWNAAHQQQQADCQQICLLVVHNIVLNAEKRYMQAYLIYISLNNGRIQSSRGIKHQRIQSYIIDETLRQTGWLLVDSGQIIKIENKRTYFIIDLHFPKAFAIVAGRLPHDLIQQPHLIEKFV